MTSYAHVFGLAEKVTKANPYHDSAGRFATADGASFVSTGPKFAKSVARLKERMAKAGAAASSVKYRFRDSKDATIEDMDTFNSSTASDYDKLSVEEKKVLYSYTQHLHRDLNQLLGGANGDTSNMSKEWQDTVGLMKAATSKMRIPEDTMLYRSLSLDNLGVKGLSSTSTPDELSKLVGRVLTDHAFSSTSLCPEASRGFQHSTKVMMQIRAPKGSKGAYVGGNSKMYTDDGPANQRSAYPNEAEVVLPSGSTFVVVGAKTFEYANSTSGFKDRYTVLEVDLLT